MKKVAILTLNDNNNYGNRLQNYALSCYLEKLKVEPYTLWIYQNSKIKLKIRIKAILSLFLKKYRLKEREKNITNFTKKHLKTINVVRDKIPKLNNKFDKFIVGSDQVWNPEVAYNRQYYFLPFTSIDKKIAYAPSMGKAKIPKEYEIILKEHLTQNNFKYVSVREETGKDILEKALNRKDVKVLIDPTMLLTKEEWIEIEKKPKIYNNEKYILNYFLGNINDKRKKEIENYALKKGYKIINILDKNDPYYNSEVEEFIYLEHHASLICTDSFHSCVFAFLFERPFIVFDREEEKMNDLGTRVDNLLNNFKLENRKFKDKILDSQLKCDYQKSFKILEEERQKSKEYLYKALK